MKDRRTDLTRFEVRLYREDPRDEALLAELENIPKARRQELVRQALVLGLRSLMGDGSGSKLPGKQGSGRKAVQRQSQSTTGTDAATLAGGAGAPKQVTETAASPSGAGDAAAQEAPDQAGPAETAGGQPDAQAAKANVSKIQRMLGQ